MIVDHRTYRVKPGQLSEYLKLDETEALATRVKDLGHCVGRYVSNDIGPLSQMVHIWVCRDLPDREAHRAKRAAHPSWPKFLDKAMPLLDGMKNKIQRPAPYFTVPELKAPA